MLRENAIFSESTSASGAGGSSIDAMSAVGCANKMVFPVIPFCWTSGAPLPRRTCLQQHRPMDASILVAFDALRTCGLSRPPQLSLAKAFKGILGFLAQRSVRQLQQAQTRLSASPTPAHRGLSLAGRVAPLPLASSRGSTGASTGTCTRAEVPSDLLPLEAMSASELSVEALA